jgi:hypothetical protein|tara:strand:+ start:720 stop:839 length:120 start_codon:yes stop_codon:yes gene_type:complete
MCVELVLVLVYDVAAELTHLGADADELADERFWNQIWDR